MHFTPRRNVFLIKIAVGLKVRIVTKSVQQSSGVELRELYASVSSLPTVQSFPGFVSFVDLDCEQMSVDSACLTGNLQEEIYMEVPARFRYCKKPNFVF